MTINSENMEAFLEKRGYKANVKIVNGNTYVIGLSSKSVDEVAKLIANISDGHRFVVTIQQNDVVELVADQLQYEQRLKDLTNMVDNKLQDMYKVCAGVVSPMDMLDKKVDSNIELCRRLVEDISYLHNKIVELIKQQQELEPRLVKLETGKSLWKKIFRRS